ncbi:MAG: DeoR/GlpR transcriptional regulator [Deltaproteobacteria bacterium]|nr:DeoR/GlpR transcriptional regulator [Deltaproteobacteria bacterium]
MPADISRRQRSIMDFIRENGSVQVSDLSANLQVTPQTIRRDLNRLYELELVQRVHGGAVIKESVENLGYGARKILLAAEKAEIGKLAAGIIPDNSSMYINIGTTTERVAEFLVDHRDMLVITNCINVASILWPSPGIEVMIAGGTIRRSDGGIVGSSTEEFINKFKLDYAVIGCSAIDDSGEFFDYDLREVRVTQAIIRHARSIIMVTDSTKLERSASIIVGNLTDLDILVIDDGISDRFLQLCRQNNVQVKIVNSSMSKKKNRWDN